jgi:hypothetical protein
MECLGDLFAGVVDRSAGIGDLSAGVADLSAGRRNLPTEVAWYRLTNMNSSAAGEQPTWRRVFISLGLGIPLI